MRQVVTHGMYAFLQIWKDKSMWMKVILVVPLSEVLPLLLVGRAYLPPDHTEAFLFTNVVWCFVASTVMQCLYVFQAITQSAKLDLLISADNGLTSWVMGYGGMTSLIYLVSTGVSCSLISLGLGYHFHVQEILLLVVLAIPVVLALMAVVLGLGLRFARIFHLINACMDVLQVLACVMYPLAALPALLKPIAVLTPLTWLNEYLWTRHLWTLIPAAGLCVIALVVSFWWMNRCVQRYRRVGDMGRSM